MPVEQTADRLVLTHPKGSSISVLLYGATVLSWQSASPSEPTILERLFVSSKAALDSSKPVRGGIPVVFPCFGAPTLPEHSRLKQHGFARSETWAWDGTVLDNEAGVSIRLTLEPSDSISGVYDKPFHLAYVMTLSEHQLSTDLHVTNTSPATTVPPEPLLFNALFHTYIRAPADLVRIGPLTGIMYVDKTQTAEEDKQKLREEQRKGVDVDKFTDFVYQNPPKAVVAVWPQGGIQIRARSLKDLVVWNPREEGKSLTDMEDNGWRNFVCVEPGVVRSFASVEPGMTWVGGQTLSVISNPGEQYSTYAT